jgi:hypothetical protein
VHDVPTWVTLLGGGGIVAALAGISATFVRVGRLLQKVDDLGDRVQRLEDRTPLPPPVSGRPTWQPRPAR